MFANDSPFWNILLIAVVGAIFIIGANTLYQNGWDKIDWVQLIALLLGTQGVETAKKVFAK